MKLVILGYQNRKGQYKEKRKLRPITHKSLTKYKQIEFSNIQRDQMGFIPRMQFWFNSQHPINLVHHTDRLKKKKII